MQLYLSRIAALRPPVGPCDRRSAVSSRSKHPIGGARSAFYGRIASLSRLALRKSDWQKIPMRKARQAVLELAGREVVITNPDKPFFPEAGHTKLHLVRYYAAVAEGALGGIAGRPIVLKRYVDGAAGEPFFQKRAPEQRPEWIETVELRFPSGRTAREIDTDRRWCASEPPLESPIKPSRRVDPSRGTDGSNPSPSSAESCANHDRQAPKSPRRPIHKGFDIPVWARWTVEIHLRFLAPSRCRETPSAFTPRTQRHEVCGLRCRGRGFHRPDGALQHDNGAISPVRDGP